MTTRRAGSVIALLVLLLAGAPPWGGPGGRSIDVCVHVCVYSM